MNAKVQFFIDLDSETMRRIDVTFGSDGRYDVTTLVQFDAGWETPEMAVSFRDRKKLARHLVNEGVPREEVDAKLQT